VSTALSDREIPHSATVQDSEQEEPIDILERVHWIVEKGVSVVKDMEQMKEENEAEGLGVSPWFPDLLKARVALTWCAIVSDFLFHLAEIISTELHALSEWSYNGFTRQRTRGPCQQQRPCLFQTSKVKCRHHWFRSGKCGFSRRLYQDRSSSKPPPWYY
jgi:hypothetical protein